jgi:hypothetical protein
MAPTDDEQGEREGDGASGTDPAVPGGGGPPTPTPLTPEDIERERLARIELEGEWERRRTVAIRASQLRTGLGTLVAGAGGAGLIGYGSTDQRIASAAIAGVGLLLAMLSPPRQIERPAELPPAEPKRIPASFTVDAWALVLMGLCSSGLVVGAWVAIARSDVPEGYGPGVALALVAVTGLFVGDRVGAAGRRLRIGIRADVHRDPRALFEGSPHWGRPIGVGDKVDVEAEARELQWLAFALASFHRRRVSRWNLAQYGIGIPAAILAGISGAAGFAEVSKTWTVVLGVLGLVGAGLTSLATALNASARAQAAAQTEAGYDAVGRSLHFGGLTTESRTPDAVAKAVVAANTQLDVLSQSAAAGPAAP